MTISFVTTKERPELAQITGAWRWQAFFSDTDVSLQDVIAIDTACTIEEGIFPTVWVLLKDEHAIGMITLCLDDVENRPELNPWLAGLYITPQYRGKGHALQLIAHIEAEASKAAIERLSLYTDGSAGLYSKAGWNIIETFDEKDVVYSIMQKQLNLS